MNNVPVDDDQRLPTARQLTRRQSECVDLVIEGLSSKEIARRLGIAPSTVDNHIAQVMNQWNIPNRAHLRSLGQLRDNEPEISGGVAPIDSQNVDEELRMIAQHDQKIPERIGKSLILLAAMFFAFLIILVTISILATMYVMSTAHS